MISPQAAERFWSKVRKGEGCWEWTAGRTGRGYGAIKIAGSQCIAPRVSWELTHGPIAPGLCVCHHCDNPACVRPEHLFLGTHSDNARDRESKGRRRKLVGERHPMAKLTEAQVGVIRSRAAAGESQRCIARDFGVSQSLVSVIALRKRWAA